MSDNGYQSAYSESGFWDKARTFALAAGERVLEPALTLFYAARDPATPAWARATVYGALGYFISPLDAVPDLTPFVGFSDDLGVLLAATAAIAMHITDAHKEQARQVLGRWYRQRQPGE